LKRQLLAKDIKSIFEQEEISTLEVIQQYGFSEKMLRNFFQPFMAGIFLENDLHTSRRMFDFMFKVFSSGDVSIPAQGMEAIPLQLAAQVGKKNILCNKKVKRIDGKKVITAEGEEFRANQILIATEATGFASHYVADGYSTDKHSVTCVYFKAPQSPLSKPIIALNASSDKVVNNLCVMSNVSPAYAPEGQHLISTSIIGLEVASDEELSETIKAEMAKWFGQLTQSWEHLKTYRIEYALPNQDSVTNYIAPKALHIKDNLFVAGDYLLNGSINAAMQSGRLAAEAIAEAIKH
jgi:protoporphyrinogen oxidase